MSSLIDITAKNVPAKIRVVMDNNYPPYIFRDNSGKLLGIAIDHWKLWEEQTGIKVEIEVMDWNLALEAAKTGNFDVIDTIFKNPEREQYLSYGKPYADIEGAIFLIRTYPVLPELSHYKGSKLGSKKGTITLIC